MGSDSFAVDIYYAVYETDMSTVDTLPWDDLIPYRMNYGLTSSPVVDWIDLNNYADSYTWVIWFEASSTKFSTWDVDIDLSLRYNWVN
jgi:hypothetical protein